MRAALHYRNVFFYKKFNKVTASNLQKPGSNIIVDPGYFRKTGLIWPLMHRLRNSNALFETRRGVEGFSIPKFEKQVLEMYQDLYRFYHQRNYRAMEALLDQNLANRFKSQCKNVPKTQELELGWNLIPNVNSAKLVQGRVHQEKISSIKVTDRWFQLTCKFSNPEGQQVYNVLQRHEKGKDFRFVKMDI